MSVHVATTSYTNKCLYIYATPSAESPGLECLGLLFYRWSCSPRLRRCKRQTCGASTLMHSRPMHPLQCSRGGVGRQGVEGVHSPGQASHTRRAVVDLSIGLGNPSCNVTIRAGTHTHTHTRYIRDKQALCHRNLGVVALSYTGAMLASHVVYLSRCSMSPPADHLCFFHSLIKVALRSH